MKNLKNNGCLYVVSTPIGNLKDITIRAIETLKYVDIVCAEDIKSTKKLLSAYGIRKEITSYREENKRRTTPRIIKEIKIGKNIALTSEAGTPLMSDPGDLLISSCVKEGIKVIPVPGPSSILAALTVSGLDTSEFSFLGFIARKGKKRREVLTSVAAEEKTTVIFESPVRIIGTLSDILKYVGDRDVALCRELTKLHEEVVRGKVSDVLSELRERGEIKGEVVVVISGKDKEVDIKIDGEALREEALKAIRENPDAGSKELAGILAEELGISKKAAYKEILGIKK